MLQDEANRGIPTMYTPTHVSVCLDERGAHKYIGRAACDLCVSRTHLYLVLTGKRTSKRLMERIKARHPELLEDGLRYSPTQSNQPTERDTP